ncbi:MAG: DUF6666 family protein [Thermoguttaceae bacterium]|jgi:hypothetical protein
MRFLLHLTAAALLLAIGIGEMTAATAADSDARAAITGRQKIRDELSAALAKGYLTRMDQYHILLHAKEVLTPDDLHGLEQTLNRIATQQATARATTTVVPSTVPVQQNTVAGSSEDVTPSKYEEPQAEGVPAIGQPKPTKAKVLHDSPFVEEVPSGIGKPAIHVDGDDPEGCESDPDEIHLVDRHWIDIDLFSSVDAFKGPLDVGNANGNFGEQLGVNAAVPVLRRLGVGLQAGTSVVLSNLKGSPYPAPNATIRDQIFTTVGMFQRINRDDGATFTWGFAYDWLFDDYYSNFHFGQWRVKAAYETDPCNEFGIQTSLPEHGSTGYLPDVFGNIQAIPFKPITQGFLYWKHTWSNDATLTGRFGMAERPGLFVFGSESRVPLSRNLALTSDVTYIMPNAAGGAVAQTQEIWNVSVGLEFALGGFGHSCTGRFQPFLPVANNGSLAVRETD